MKKCSLAFIFILTCCTPKTPSNPSVPALEYSARLKQEIAASDAASQRKASLRFVSDELPVQEDVGSVRDSQYPSDQPGNTPAFEVYRSSNPMVRDYNGPLSVGDPGVSASLWKETRSMNDLFRDNRAFRPMDLITVLVTENSEGKKEADTETKEKSSIALAIDKLLGYEKDVTEALPNLDPTSLVNGSVTNDFKGEGETNRKGSLTAKISAMVMEVLPSGILRIEGEKIIAVNSEEQVMVISGLVRPNDINSANEVVSAKVANMRIDYYGRGVVGEAQDGGWASRLIRIIWPF